jgi:hypothetical protein
MNVRRELNLLATEDVWLLEAWATDGERLTVPADTPPLEVVRAEAKSLLFEVARLHDGRLALIHRVGWPYALQCHAGDVVGLLTEETLPRGAGDAAMRSFVEAVAARGLGWLVVRDP